MHMVDDQAREAAGGGLWITTAISLVRALQLDERARERRRNGRARGKRARCGGELPRKTRRYKKASCTPLDSKKKCPRVCKTRTRNRQMTPRVMYIMKGAARSAQKFQLEGCGWRLACGIGAHYVEGRCA